MEVTINHEDIAKAIEASATKAIADRMGGYQVREAIASTITDDLANGIMADAIRKAIEAVDTAKLSNALASQLQLTMTAALNTLLEDAAVDMVARMRGLQDYDSKATEKKAAIKAQMFGLRDVV